jgi:peptidoglycan hydrolase-like protein with peptidoglycan-binding domain
VSFGFGNGVFSRLFFLNTISQIRRITMLRKLLLVISASLLFASVIAAQDTSKSASTATTAKTVDTTKKPTAFRPTKDQIKQGQTMLKDKKLYDGEATGVYNDATRAALKAYQKENGLEANGKFDKATLEKMGVSAEPKTAGSTTKPSTTEKPSSTSRTAKRPAPFRANADQIKAAQKMLKDGKMYTGEESGKLDDTTRASLKKYQETNGLRVMGSLNAATLEKMGIALTDAQKANVAAQAAYDAAKAPKN